jgi:hypothetical protein
MTISSHAILGAEPTPFYTGVAKWLSIGLIANLLTMDMDSGMRSFAHALVERCRRYKRHSLDAIV